MAARDDVDWRTWHDNYDDPDSSLARRLTIVQDALRVALDTAPARPITLISLCAGQARDVLGVVPGHARRADVRGRLVELDPENAATARAGVEAAGLAGIEVVRGDAARTDAYLGVAPADVVLACGIFGNISDDDVRRVVAALPALCRPGATVLWTRNRREPDLTPSVRRWFAAESFEEVAFVAPPDLSVTVGSHRYVGPPRDLVTGVRRFRFIQ
jgi:hypothetical protein